MLRSRSPLSRLLSRARLATCALPLVFGSSRAQDTLSDSASRAQKLNAVTIVEHQRFVNTIIGEVNQRRRAGHGYFTDSTTLAKLPGVMESFNFPNVRATGTPGAWGIEMSGNVMSLSDGASGASNTRTASGRGGFSSGGAGMGIATTCQPTIWIDGAKTDGSVLPLLHKEDLAIIEIFNSAARAPLKYQDNGFCGAVLFWTKRYLTP